MEVSRCRFESVLPKYDPSKSIKSVMSLKKLPSSTKRIVHHFGVGSKLFDDIKRDYSSLLVLQEVTDVFWDTKDFSLVRQNIWLRSRDLDDDSQRPSSWSLKRCENQQSNGEFEYSEETDHDKIVEVLKKLLPQDPKFYSIKSTLNSRSGYILDIFELYSKSVIASNRLFFQNEEFRFHVDCFKIGEKIYILGGVSFNASTSTHALIELLKSSEGYFPNVRSKVLEDFAHHYPETTKLLQKKGIINKEITFLQDHAHDSSEKLPINPPKEEIFWDSSNLK